MGRQVGNFNVFPGEENIRDATVGDWSTFNTYFCRFYS